MNSQGATELVQATSARWVADSESDVVWAGEHEGRLGVRMAQSVRDFTTVWFDVGDLTIGYEAYVAPPPPRGVEEVYRQCLVRNRAWWRVHFALDAEGGLVLVGRSSLAALDESVLDAALGSIYEAVELSFRAIVAAGFGREKNS
ncbi:MAG: type III secretion system chaperone [Acidimicrobiia bacterium]|nr:type III secretion system chaperone [Acidimicrobiia bacterium]MDH3470474.1 type III secretion system chaperone [Acidimicrobiia bacterium]